MNVIFNADDYGFSKAVNLGIQEAFRNGQVRSATIMSGMPGFEHAVEIAKENPGLGIGAHLTLTAGKSIGGVYKTITDETGAFLKLNVIEQKAKAGEIDLGEVEREYEAQIQKITSAGIKIDHLDGHHHTQRLPGIVGIFLKTAKKYGVAVRIYDNTLLSGEYADVKSTGDFSEAFFGEDATLDTLKNILTGSKAESIEIMCHPAYVDHTLYTNSSYNVNRVFELDILTGEELSGFMNEQGHKLCNFAAL